LTGPQFVAGASHLPDAATSSATVFAIAGSLTFLLLVAGLILLLLWWRSRKETSTTLEESIDVVPIEKDVWGDGFQTHEFHDTLSDDGAAGVKSIEDADSFTSSADAEEGEA
jgi:hypothetical protein